MVKPARQVGHGVGATKFPSAPHWRLNNFDVLKVLEESLHL